MLVIPQEQSCHELFNTHVHSSLYALYAYNPRYFILSHMPYKEAKFTFTDVVVWQVLVFST